MFRRIQELQLGLEHRRSCPYQKLIRPSHHAATRREASLACPVVWHSPCRCMSGYTPHRLAVEEPRHTLIVSQPSPQLVREGTDAEGPHLTANAPAGGGTCLRSACPDAKASVVPACSAGQGSRWHARGGHHPARYALHRCPTPPLPQRTPRRAAAHTRWAWYYGRCRAQTPGPVWTVNEFQPGGALPESTHAGRRRAADNAEAQPSCRVGDSQAWAWRADLVPGLVG
jgi:hypothetical protein